MVPAKRRWCQETPQGTTGATATAGPMSAAVARHNASALMVSVETAIFGPCCSWAPTGTRTSSMRGSRSCVSGEERSASKSGSWATERVLSVIDVPPLFYLMVVRRWVVQRELELLALSLLPEHGMPCPYQTTAAPRVPGCSWSPTHGAGS